MRPAYSVAQVRAAERSLLARLPEGALMQRAATGLAGRCAQLLGSPYGARVALLVGTGDNGGDALYAGARLAARGARVRAVRTGERAHASGLAALRAAGGRLAAPAELAGADLVVDGILGIGGSGALRPPAAELVADLDARVVACDLPSGVDADTGRVAGAAVRAEVTVTFGALKPGVLVSPGAEHAGSVELVDIGLRPHLPPAELEVLDAVDVAARLPVPRGETSKYLRGVVGVVAGSETYPGAAVLATGGAVRAGAGMVRYVGPPHPSEQVRQRWPEVLVTEGDPADAGRVQAWVVGPGLGTDERAERALAQVLESDLPVLVDADGVTLLAQRHDLWHRAAPTLLTPHAGELARLLATDRDAVEAERLAHARRAAAEVGATVLLKGSTTVVVDARGRGRVNPTGTAWLATAGSGDVLSGATGALLAGGLEPLDAASCGAFLHGLAGQLAAGAPAAPIAAGDLVARWPQAVRVVTS